MNKRYFTPKMIEINHLISKNQSLDSIIDGREKIYIEMHLRDDDYYAQCQLYFLLGKSYLRQYRLTPCKEIIKNAYTAFKKQHKIAGVECYYIFHPRSLYYYANACYTYAQETTSIFKRQRLLKKTDHILKVALRKFDRDPALKWLRQMTENEQVKT